MEENKLNIISGSNKPMDRKTYEKWHDLQIGQPAYDTPEVLQKLWDWTDIKTLEDLDVLEVGCGNGNFLRILSKSNPKSITGLDINPDFTKNSEFKVVASLQEELPFEDKSFDLYVSSETLEHSCDYKKAISEMYRVLRPGGKALIGLPWGSTHSDTLMHYSAIGLGLTEETPAKVLQRLKNDRLKMTTIKIINNGNFEELRILIELNGK